MDFEQVRFQTAEKAKKEAQYVLLFYCRYLNLIVSNSSGIRKQDGVRAFSSVAANAVGTEIAFDFMYTKLNEIAE